MGMVDGINKGTYMYFRADMIDSQSDWTKFNKTNKTISLVVIKLPPPRINVRQFERS